MYWPGMASGAGVGAGPRVRVAVRSTTGVRVGPATVGGGCRRADMAELVPRTVAVRVGLDGTRVLVAVALPAAASDRAVAVAVAVTLPGLFSLETPGVPGAEEGVAGGRVGVAMVVGVGAVVLTAVGTARWPSAPGPPARAEISRLTLPMESPRFSGPTNMTAARQRITRASRAAESCQIRSLDPGKSTCGLLSQQQHRAEPRIPVPRAPSHASARWAYLTHALFG